MLNSHEQFQYDFLPREWKQSIVEDFLMMANNMCWKLSINFLSQIFLGKKSSGEVEEAHTTSSPYLSLGK